MSLDLEKQLLEERKVKAIEKIAKILDNLTLWFEEVDKEEWGERIQYYLSEFLSKKEETPLSGIDLKKKKKLKKDA
jgi:hypothetical protein|tara:strand:+ start:163 stop:390 length:228 start_codon:yes stop_codon:yes gene_type:complete